MPETTAFNDERDIARILYGFVSRDDFMLEHGLSASCVEMLRAAENELADRMGISTGCRVRRKEADAEMRRRAMGMYGLIQGFDQDELLAQLSEIVIKPGDFRPLPDYALEPGSDEPPAQEARLVLEPFFADGNQGPYLVRRPEDGNWSRYVAEDLYGLCNLFFDDRRTAAVDPLRPAIYRSSLVLEGDKDYVTGISVYDERGFRRPATWVILDLIYAVQKASSRDAYKYARVALPDAELAAAFLVRAVSGRLLIVD